MKVWFRIISMVMLLVLGVTFMPTQPMARSAPIYLPPVSGDYKPGELLVRFSPGASIATAQTVRSRYGAQYLSNLYASDVQLWQVPVGEELAIMQALNADAAIDYAEPNYIYRIQLTPNDPSYGSQWGLPQINAPAAWDITTGNNSVTIAIVDTGVDLDHPDLAAKIVAGYDFVEGDTIPQDLNGHGTHVAGIAAALTNNGGGVAGVSWGARIMPVRVLDANGSGYLEDVANGITWACSNGAKVINLSLGGPSNNATLENAVNNAHTAGCLIVAAAGNCGDSNYAANGCTYQNQPSYPGAYANAFAVAATTSTDTRAAFSTQGNQVDIAAPGQSIYSTDYNDTYGYLSGTSQAAPFVAGLAALVWSANPSLTVAQVRQVIETSAVDLGAAGKDQAFGWGRINAQAAVAQVAVPGIPTLYDISNPTASGSFTVDWSDAINATSYQLQESTSATFITINQTYTPTASQQAIAGKTEGVWYYRVRAGNAVGESAWSATRSTTVINTPILSPISNADNDGNYTVSWVGSALATGYTLEEANNSGFTGATLVYQGSATSYDITWQPAGMWYYRVRATSGTQQTGWSSLASATVNAYSVAAPALSIQSNDGDGDYIVTWSTIGGATAYVLEESRSPYFTAPQQVYTGAGLQYSVTDKPGGTWHYRVRATSGGNSSAWSARQTAVVTSYIYLPLVLRNFTPPVPVFIVNGDFEQGATGWTQYSSHNWRLIVSFNEPGMVSPHSGNLAVWLGGEVNDVSYIQQQVIVPASHPYLAYYRWIASEDVCGFDRASVRVNGDAVSSYDLCQTNNTGGWVLHSVNLGAYAGQSVALQFRVETDESLNSNLFIDDVEFRATGMLQSIPLPPTLAEDVIAPRRIP